MVVFVADTDNNRIQTLNPDFSYIDKFGSEGDSPGEFSSPYNIAIDSSGVVYVTDLHNHRVQLFSANGKYNSPFGSEGLEKGQFNQPSGICVDSTNTLYITDDENHRVCARSSTGTAECWETEKSLAKDSYKILKE